MKKFFKENKVFVIMMLIVLVCLIIIGSLLLVYFYQGKNENPYGNRLNDVENVKITPTETADIEHKILENKEVEAIKIEVYGKIIYLNYTFVAGTKLDAAKSKAILSLDEFSEEIQKLYEFQFSIKENADAGFITSGAKNSTDETVIWNNNTEVVE